MLLNQRRSQILAILHQQHYVTVDQLCQKLYASPATIRRDLSEMAEQGTLLRLRGGAELLKGSNNDMPLQLRLNKDREKKERIASLAARFTEEASTLFMDSSSTAYYLAKQLGNHTGKSIITNGLATANYLNEHTAATVYITGGRLFQQSGCVGRQAEEIVKTYCADILIFSCCGFTVENGPTEAEGENAEIKRVMAKNAKCKILLCDSTKFGRDYFCRVCPISDIDMIITDRKPDDTTVFALQEKIVWE